MLQAAGTAGLGTLLAPEKGGMKAPRDKGPVKPEVRLKAQREARRRLLSWTQVTASAVGPCITQRSVTRSGRLQGGSSRQQGVPMEKTPLRHARPGGCTPVVSSSSAPWERHGDKFQTENTGSTSGRRTAGNRGRAVPRWLWLAVFWGSQPLAGPPCALVLRKEPRVATGRGSRIGAFVVAAAQMGSLPGI